MTRLLSGTVIVAATYVGVLSVGGRGHGRGLVVAVILTFWVIALAATVWATREQRPLSRPVLTMALLTLAVQLPGVFTPPQSSSDAWRYVWDGRVQLSGISPYRYVPLDDRLAGLRDPVLFPGLTSGQPSGVTTLPLPTDRAQLLNRARNDERTRINRPQVPTIYPPVAQLWFALAAAVTPWSAGTLGIQIASALLAAAVAGVLAAWLLRRGRNPRETLWWAWCPAVILEAGNGGHVDILSAAFVVGAVVALSTRAGRAASTAVAGLLLGAAASVKLTPLALLPAFMPLRHNGIRHSWQAPLVASGTFVASYLPHVVAVGALVIGYLPGYLSEEGGGDRAGLLRLFVPDDLLTPAMFVVMGAVAIWAVRAARADAPQQAAVVLFGSLLLVTTPSYPWYGVPLVALAVLSQRLEWLAVAVAGYVAYGGPGLRPLTATGGYALAVSVVFSAALWRRRPLGPFRGRLRWRQATREAAATTPRVGLPG